MSTQWGLGLSEEAVQGLKFKFWVLGPKIQNSSLMVVNLLGWEVAGWGTSVFLKDKNRESFGRQSLREEPNWEPQLKIILNDIFTKDSVRSGFKWLM
jgi:hypothetical protein